MFSLGFTDNQDMQKKQPKIALIDYEAGNLKSVQQSCQKLGYSAQITRNAEEIANADLLILPGQGAFAAAKQSLDQHQLSELIVQHYQKNKALLAICIGFQLLFSSSTEAPNTKGLSLFEGHFEHFDKNKGSVPHMGWNSVDLNAQISAKLPNNYFYFVHSYYTQATVSNTYSFQSDYHGPFTAMLYRNNFMATQFHPEKSGETGLALLDYFFKELSL